MNLFHFIGKLRNKSEQDRRAISLVGASIMFSLVFFVWLTTFQLASEQIENEEDYNELSPIVSLKNMSSRFFADIKEELFNEKDSAIMLPSQLQTETAITHTAVINVLDENIVGTTTENIFFENNEKNENLSGTSSDETEIGTSSESVDNIDDTIEFIEDINEDEEEPS